MFIALFFSYTTLPSLALFAIFIVGMFLLWKGADWLTSGAGSLALHFRVNPVIIGLTILAVATSMPEFLTVLVSAHTGGAGMAIGNIVGSNVCNIGLILGFAAMISPVLVHTRIVRRDMPLLMALTLAFTALCWGGIRHWEGIVLSLLLVAYVGYMVINAKRIRKAALREEAEAREVRDELQEDVIEEIGEQIESLGKCWLAIIGGGLGLALGAEFLVKSATEAGIRLEVSEVLIGLTVVAIGTSLPELAASVAAAMKKQNELLAGNIVGSNLFNIMMVGGVVSSIYGLEVEKALFKVEFPAMIAVTILLYVVLLRKGEVTKLEGAVLLIAYAAFIGISTYFQLTQGKPLLPTG